jgi:hypothetical protein
VGYGAEWCLARLAELDAARAAVEGLALVGAGCHLHARAVVEVAVEAALGALAATLQGQQQVSQLLEHTNMWAQRLNPEAQAGASNHLLQPTAACNPSCAATAAAAGASPAAAQWQLLLHSNPLQVSYTSVAS